MPAFATAAEFLDRTQRAEDFAEFCKFVAEQYAYFDIKKTDWTRTCKVYAPQAADTDTRDAYIGVLERAMAEIYDHHAHLGTNTRQSPRLVPSGTDLVGAWHDGHALIEYVRDHSAAASAGVTPGMQVLAVDDEAIDAAARRLAPKFLTTDDPAARRWALQIALAGHRDRDAVHLQVKSGSTVRTLDFKPSHEESGLIASRMSGEVGYLRVNNSLGENELTAAFDQALATMNAARAFVVDLRDTPGGGTSTVARGIMGRFINEAKPYQRHELVGEFRSTGIRRTWVEYVSPREPYLSQPVVVLVGPWTGSMGEGIAIGFNAIRGAPVIGAPMAHLLGAIDQIELPHSRIVVRVPTEKVFHVDGTPREAFLPCPVQRQSSDKADGDLDFAITVAARLVAQPPPTVSAVRAKQSCHF